MGLVTMLFFYFYQYIAPLGLLARKSRRDEIIIPRQFEMPPKKETPGKVSFIIGLRVFVSGSRLG